MRKKRLAKEANGEGNSLRKAIRYYALWILIGGVGILGGVGLVRLVVADNQVHQIAKHFRCICEMHCSLIAANCKCTKPGGASDVKRMIRDGLRRGLKANEIMHHVNEEYGGLIV